MMETIGIVSLGTYRSAHDFDRWREWGYNVKDVRLPEEIVACDGLHLPGGESEVILKAIYDCGMADPLKEFAGRGGHIWGACAGMVCMSKTAIIPANTGRDAHSLHHQPLGLMDIEVVRFDWPQGEWKAFEILPDGTRGECYFYDAPRPYWWKDYPSRDTCTQFTWWQDHSVATCYWTMDEDFQKSFLKWWLTL